MLYARPVSAKIALRVGLALAITFAGASLIPPANATPPADQPNWSGLSALSDQRLRVCANPSAAATRGSEQVTKPQRANPADLHLHGPSDVTIAAFGDVLLHSQLQQQGFADFAGFRSLWRKMEPFLSSADIAIANLEGPVAEDIQPNRTKAAAPVRHFDNNVYTGYPMFNYPPAALHALTAAGIDLVSIANNHSYDRGLVGFEATIDALQHNGLAFAGGKSRHSPAETPRWGAAESREGDKIAFVACSYGFNVPAPEQERAPLCFADRAELLETIAGLSCRRDIAGVVFLPHWGQEYVVRPTREQRELAYQALEAGALAVIGAHPHVVQPVEPYKTADGRVGVIAFSLGNFASAQVEEPRRTSIVLYLNLARGPNGQLRVASIRYLPIETRHTRTDTGKRFDVVPISVPGAAAVRYAELVRDGQLLSQEKPRQGGGADWQYAPDDSGTDGLTARSKAVQQLMQDIASADASTKALVNASGAALRLETNLQDILLQQAAIAAQLQALGIRRNRVESRITALRSELDDDAHAALQREGQARIGENDVRGVDDASNSHRLVIDADSLFVSNSATVRTDAGKLLESIAETVKSWGELPGLQGDNWRLEIQGHADERPLISNRYRSNRHLSAERALAVVEALIGAGIDGNRIFASGFGASAPIAPESTSDAHAQNRRVELILRRN